LLPRTRPNRPGPLQSWHWESRKYDAWAEDATKRLLKAVEASSGTHRVRVTEIKSCKAEASVNIRKGKKITVFELTFKCAWEGAAFAGPASEAASGEAEVAEVMQDDLDDSFDVRVMLLKATSNEIGIPCKELMRTAGAAAIRAAVKAFAAELQSHDAELEDLATAQVRAARPLEPERSTQVRNISFAQSARPLTPPPPLASTTEAC
jgi:activator of HSP90 ATPase